MPKLFWKNIDGMLDFMVSKYPTTFFPKDSPDTKPLRVGIFTRISGDNPNIHRAAVAEFLRQYTSKTRYQRALATCPHRVEIDGSDFEPVSDSARDRALSVLAERELKSKTRVA